MLFLTIVRALSLIAAPTFLLVSVLVALPTSRLLDPFWFLLALVAAGVYVLSTYLFVLFAERFRRKKWGQHA